MSCTTAARAATDGKHPVTALAGPYGHPFHPILVTVPIGAWVASLVLVISRTVDDAAVFAKGAWWLIVIGIVGALAAAIFGFLDLFAIPTGTRAFKTALAHMAINLAVVGLSPSAPRSATVASMTSTAPNSLLALSAVALASLAVSGWLGGKLTYRYGVRVVDESTQADAYRP